MKVSWITSLNSNLYNTIILIRTNFHVPSGKNSPLFELSEPKSISDKSQMKPVYCSRCQWRQETLSWHSFDCNVLGFSQHGSKGSYSDISLNVKYEEIVVVVFGVFLASATRYSLLYANWEPKTIFKTKCTKKVQITIIWSFFPLEISNYRELTVFHSVAKKKTMACSESKWRDTKWLQKIILYDKEYSNSFHLFVKS